MGTEITHIPYKPITCLAGQNLPSADPYTGDTPAKNLIHLTEPQTKMFQATQRFVAFVAGFGAGKTHALVLKMLVDKFQYPDVDLLYCAPTYSLIRDIAYIKVIEFLNTMPVKYNLNKAENVLYIQGFGRILFRTMDRPELIVGFSVLNGYLDELDVLRMAHASAFWNKVIARTRQKSRNPDAKNRIFVATTPEGYRFVYNRWHLHPTEDYELIRAPTSSNPHLPEGYIDALKASYPSQLIEAYLEGEFVNLVGASVYYNFSRTKNALPKNTPAAAWPTTHRVIIHIGVDFNIHNTAAAFGVVAGGKCYILGEMTGILDTPTLVKEIDAHYEKFAQDIVYYPDATGKNAKSTNASVSDHTILQRTGAMIDAPPGNPAVRDRVAAVNSALGNAEEEPLLYIDIEACPRLVQALEQQVYVESGSGKLSPDKSSGYDHILDALGYLIYRRFPVKDMFVGTLEIVGV